MNPDQSHLYNLSGKKVLVTGASSGIGKSCSLMLTKQGADVFITGRNSEALTKTSQLMDGDVNNIFHADFTVESDISKLAAKIPELDGIVLSAGIIKTVPVRFIKKSLLTEVFQTNLFANILLVQLLLKNKKIKRGAAICFISSIASRFVHPGNSVYSASKGAINSFARNLALELAPKSIRVNTILPGMIATGMLSDISASEEQLEDHLKNYPLGRFGTPEDVAGLVVYLLSDSSAWMTGAMITLDGGYSLK